MTIKFSKEEESAIRDMCECQGLTEHQVIKQALRLYQLRVKGYLSCVDETLKIAQEYDKEDKRLGEV